MMADRHDGMMADRYDSERLRGFDNGWTDKHLQLKSCFCD